MLEYDRGELAALVEYKFHTQNTNTTQPSVQCLIGIAAKCEVPLLLVHYVAGDDWVFRVRPLNNLARKWFPRCHQIVSEREWVTFLYRVRDREVPDAVQERLRDLPEFWKPCPDE